MEREKINCQKLKKLKVRADSTTEEINNQLEFTEQITEFQTFISCYPGFANVFLLLNQALLNQKQLEKLSISLNYLHDVTYKDTLFNLRDLKQLTNLSLSFSDEIYFAKAQTERMSSSLSQFPFLKTLEINIKTDFIDSEIELFEFYQSNIQLTSISFVVSQDQENSNIFHSLLRGLRFQKSLKSLKLHTDSRNLRAYPILNLLEDEFKENNNIENIDLDFGWKVLSTEYDLVKFDNLVKNFTKLEKLTFSPHNFWKKSELKNAEFEDNLLKLTKLKELILKFKRPISTLPNIITNSVRMESLQSVQLQLSVSSSQIGADIVSFGQQLAQIKHLNMLDIQFHYGCKINTCEVIKFISQFKSAKNLKELNIWISCFDDPFKKIKDENLEYSDLMEVINNLEKYSFMMSIDKQFNEGQIDNILSSIQNAKELQSITLRFNGYQSNNDQKKLLNLNAILTNKRNLTSINFDFQNIVLLEESHIINIFEDLKQNPQLSQIGFSFLNELSFSYLLLQKLSESLVQLQKLRDLRIIINNQIQLNNEGLNCFADSMSSLKALKKLTLQFSKNSFSLSALNHLVSSFRNLNKLSILDLRIYGASFVNDEDEKSFGDSFEFSKKLKKLDIVLIIKKLKYKNMRNLIQSISKEQKLEHLILNVQLSPDHEEAKEILHYLSKLRNVQYIEFQSYTVSMLALSTLLTSLPLLRDINLDHDYNQILSNVEAGKKLIRKIKSRSPSLNEDGQLDVQEYTYNTYLIIVTEQLLNNEIKKNSDLILQYVFQNLSFLNELHLYFYHDNNIGVDISSNLFKQLSLLQNLSSLKIQIKKNNQIGTQSLNELGIALSKLKLLENLLVEIYYYKNKIQLSENLTLFQNLRNLTQLEQLEFRLRFEDYSYDEDKQNDNENQQTIGQLFESLSYMTNLKSLKLIITDLLLSQEVINLFNSSCYSLKQKITLLFLYFKVSLQELDLSSSLLTQTLKQFHKLNELNTNLPLEALHKHLRLVNYNRVSYYYSDDE